MKAKKTLVILSILTFVIGYNLLSSYFFDKNFFSNAFHSPHEIEKLIKLNQVPIDSNEYFLHSKNCQGCHGFDTLHIANIDANGNDVNLFDDWQATMMANAARDPLWRAKVSHEILVNPAHALELQDKCTSCHAPMGHYTSVYKGFAHYTIADLDNDSLGLDGVSCVGCHAIGPNGLGTMFSGQIPYDTNRVEYGPFLNPLTGPMQLYVGLIPTHSTHVSESRMCSSCHTLITKSVDLAGNFTGRSFVEQATFHEWLNSAAGADNVTCQNCHMPQILDSVIIANQYMNLPPRAPFNKHKFNGGNAFMIKLIKDNKTKLGISTEDARFDSSIAITKRTLRNNTLDLTITLDSLTLDTAFVKVHLLNKAGHKFPTGYPSRRGVLQVVAIGNLTDTIFQSGIFDSNYEVKYLDPVFEPHYNIINDTTQSQIYEMIMADVNLNKTTVLERADTLLKDNRLVPEGFSTSALQYDTIPIVGNVMTDPNFNHYPGGAEGSGTDNIYYHIAVTGYSNAIKVYAKMYYQPVPPGWLQELFTYSSAPIDSFKNMYNAANKSPNLVACDSLNNFVVGLKSNQLYNQLVISPDPTSDGYFNISFPNSEKVDKVQILSMNGQLISQQKIALVSTMVQSQLPENKGVYFVRVYFLNGQVVTKKVIRL